MSRIIGQVKRYANSKWTTVLRPAAIHINLDMIFPEVQFWDPSSEGPNTVVHACSMMDLTDCGANEGSDKIFLTFKEEVNEEINYVTIEFNKLVGRKDKEADKETKTTLFKAIIKSATSIRDDLKTPYVSKILSPYSLPKSYNFNTEYSAICVFLGKEDNMYRIGEPAMLSLVPGSELKAKGMKFDSEKTSKYLDSNWIVIDAGNSGTAVLPITPNTIFDIVPNDLQFSVVINEPSGSRRTASKSMFYPLAFVFTNDQEFANFTGKFAEYFALSARRDAGFKVEAPEMQKDNSLITSAFCPTAAPRSKDKKVPVVELSSDSDRNSDVEVVEEKDSDNARNKPVSVPFTVVKAEDDSTDYLAPNLVYYNPRDQLLGEQVYPAKVSQFLFQESCAAISRENALELCFARPKLQATPIEFKDDAGSILTPGVLHFGTNTDSLLSTAIDISEKRRDIIYRKDLNRLDTLQLYKATDLKIDYHPEIVDFDVGKAGAAAVGACPMDPSNAIVALTKMGVHLLDTRMAGDSQCSGVSYRYKSDVRFSSILVTPSGHVITGSMAGEVRIFNKLGNRALTCYPGSGYPITNIAITKDEKWILATTQTILFVYSTMSVDGEQSCFSGHGIAADKRREPIVLRLSPETLAEIGASSNTGLRSATFSLDETEIITGTEKYVIIWDFTKVKSGIVSSSKACTKFALNSQVIGAGMGFPDQIMVGMNSGFRLLDHKTSKTTRGNGKKK